MNDSSMEDADLVVSFMSERWLDATAVNFHAEADNPLGAFHSFDAHDEVDVGAPTVVRSLDVLGQENMPVIPAMSSPPAANRERAVRTGNETVHIDVNTPSRSFRKVKAWSHSILPTTPAGGRRGPSSSNLLAVVRQSPATENSRIAAAGDMLKKFQNDRRKEVHHSCVSVALFGTGVARAGGLVAAAGFSVILIRRVTQLLFSGVSCPLLGLGMGLSGLGLGFACCGILVATTVPPDEVDWLAGGGIMTSRLDHHERVAISNNLHVAALIITLLLLLVALGFGFEGNAPSHAVAAVPMVAYVVLNNQSRSEAAASNLWCCKSVAGAQISKTAVPSSSISLSSGSLSSRPPIVVDDSVVTKEEAELSELALDNLEQGLGQGMSDYFPKTTSLKKTQTAAEAAPPLEKPLLNFPAALSCTLVLISLASAAIPLRWLTATEKEKESLPYVLEDTSYPEPVWWLTASLYIADALVSGLRVTHLLYFGGNRALVPSKNAVGLVVGEAVSAADSGHAASLVAYQVFTQSALMNGCLCLVVSAFLLTLGANSGFVCVEAPAFLLVTGLLVSLPALWVTVMGRPQVFRFLMNRFDLTYYSPASSQRSSSISGCLAFPTQPENEGVAEVEEEEKETQREFASTSNGASPRGTQRPQMARSTSSLLSFMNLSPRRATSQSGSLLPQRIAAELASLRTNPMAPETPQRLVKRSQKDGAFVAELLDSFPITVGLTWWVHRKPGDSFGLERYKDETDHRRHWRKGRVVGANDSSFVVELLVQSDSKSASSSSSSSSSPSPSPSRSSTSAAAPPPPKMFVNGGKQHMRKIVSAPTYPQQQHQRRKSFSGASSPLPPLPRHTMIPENVSGDHTILPRLSSLKSSSSLVEREELPMKQKNVTSDQLLSLAALGLRCIDWDEEVMGRLILGGAVCGEGDKVDSGLRDLFALSRPLKPGETIDYFISHSWHDEGKLKLALLKSVVRNFKRRKKRNPTFWLDKVCIDQENIGDGLKVLPINIMACRRVLVLCGPTYTKRLWCVWELCTLFFMRDLEEVLDRVELVTFEDDAGMVVGGRTIIDGNVLGEEETRQGGGGSFDLESFKLANAHCYDPNEEARLRDVIKAVGEQQFHQRVRELARAFRTDVRILARQHRLTIEQALIVWQQCG